MVNAQSVKLQSQYFVETITLNDLKLLEKVSQNFDLIKIDIEGGEHSIANDLVEFNAKYILGESHSISNYNKEDFILKLRSSGYQVETFWGKKDNFINFKATRINL